jgi:hypothetical protein
MSALFTYTHFCVIVCQIMSELLMFPLHHENKHRRARDSSTKQKVMRAVGAGLFAVSAYIGIKHGIDAITEDRPGTQLVAATSSTGRITTEQTHAAAREAIDETITDMNDVMYGVGGLTVSIGIGVVGLAKAASRNERQNVGPAHIPEDLLLTESLLEPHEPPMLEAISLDPIDWNHSDLSPVWHLPTRA